MGGKKNLLNVIAAFIEIIAALALIQIRYNEPCMSGNTCSFLVNLLTIFYFVNILTGMVYLYKIQRKHDKKKNEISGVFE